MSRGHTFKELDYEPRVEWTGKDRYTVTYGKEIHAGLDYAAACMELGRALMHTLTNMSKFD